MTPARFSVIYRAEIKIPDPVFHNFGNSSEYESMSLKFSGDFDIPSSGQDSYSSVYEWAESPDKNNIENWAKAWESFVLELERRMLR